MLSKQKRLSNKNTLGSELKDGRVAAKLTQKDLAVALGLEYYTMISQMELGYISIPPTLWGPIADSLKIKKANWVLRCLQTIQPDVYEALFKANSVMVVSQVLDQLSK